MFSKKKKLRIFIYTCETSSLYLTRSDLTLSHLPKDSAASLLSPQYHHQFPHPSSSLLNPPHLSSPFLTSTTPLLTSFPHPSPHYPHPISHPYHVRSFRISPYFLLQCVTFGNLSVILCLLRRQWVFVSLNQWTFYIIIDWPNVFFCLKVFFCVNIYVQTDYYLKWKNVSRPIVFTIGLIRKINFIMNKISF